MATPPSGNPKGRPPKNSKSNPVGRPKGEATVMKEYRRRLLNSPRSSKVIDAIFGVALAPEHKHWPAAMKLIADRILPVSGFEKDAGSSGRTKYVVEIKDAGVVSFGDNSEEPAREVNEVTEAEEAVFEELPDVSPKPQVRQEHTVKFKDAPVNGLKDMTEAHE